MSSSNRFFLFGQVVLFIFHKPCCIALNFSEIETNDLLTSYLNLKGFFQNDKSNLS